MRNNRLIPATKGHKSSMTMLKRASILLLFLISGCDQLELLNTEDKQLLLKINSKTDINTSSKILHKRFSEYRKNIFSTIETKIIPGEIKFTFKNGAPEIETIKSLVSIRGNLVAKSQTGIKLFTSRDIINASTSQTDGINYLSLTISDEAAKKILKFTKENSRKILSFYFNKKPLTGVVVHGEINKHFMISVEKSKKELSLIAVILRSGELPGNVEFIKYVNVKK